MNIAAGVELQKVNCDPGAVCPTTHPTEGSVILSCRMCHTWPVCTLFHALFCHLLCRAGGFGGGGAGWEQQSQERCILLNDTVNQKASNIRAPKGNFRQRSGLQRALQSYHCTQLNAFEQRLRVKEQSMGHIPSSMSVRSTRILCGTGTRWAEGCARHSFQTWNCSVTCSFGTPMHCEELC